MMQNFQLSDYYYDYVKLDAAGCKCLNLFPTAKAFTLRQLYVLATVP